MMYSVWLRTVAIRVRPLTCYTAQTSAGLVCNSANVPALAVDRQPSLSPALFSHLKSGMIGVPASKSCGEDAASPFT